MLDLTFSTPGEIVKRLCQRLRLERLAQHMTQAELAARAGISSNTLSNLEAGRNVGFEGVVRVAMVLGRANELENLFQPRLDSLADLQRYEDGARRKRIRRKKDDA